MGWRLDERAFAGRENLDPRHAERYDAKEDADAAAEVALLRGHGLGPDALVVELGPGTGQFTVEAAPACERIVAVDVSEVMLAQLREKVAAARLANVEMVQAGFLSYEHPGRPADLVYSRLALHHLPDFWKALALRRIHGFLRPGGVFRLVDVVYGFEPAQAEARLEAWCAAYPEHGGEGEWTRADVEEHVRDEHSTFTWILEPMLERCGFDVVVAEHAPDGVMAKYLLRRRPLP